MDFELYDILTLEDGEFVISSIIVEGKNEYFLLNEIDEEENVKDNVKIMKRAIENNLEPDVLYEVEEANELQKVSKLLENAMLDNLKEVE